MDIEQKIDEILKKRKESLPAIRHEEERCAKVLSSLAQLEDKMQQFVQASPSSEGAPICENALSQFPLLRQSVNNLQAKIHTCSQRFTRNSINIGFGGGEGTGKSFLLQKLSGLSNNEVPSSKGYNVTAVNSHIFNAVGEEPYAAVLFFTQEEFLREVLDPFYKKLDLSTPYSLSNFFSSPIPEVEDFKRPLREKLVKFQTNSSQYRTYLTGKTERYPVKNLRRFVSYRDENDNESFTYLAVKTIDIFTPFPQTNVKKLGMFDLPGLGEINPRVEELHRRGLNNEVDVALVLRHPKNTRIAWNEQDEHIFEVLRKTRSEEELPHFLIFVQNEGDCDPEQAEKSYISLKENLPSYFKCIRTKGSTTEQLSQDVLLPVLDHLGESLPLTDNALISGIQKECQSVWDRVRIETQKIYDQLKVLAGGGYDDERYEDEGKRCLDEFSRLCDQAITDIDLTITKGEEDERLLQRIAEIELELDSYFENGLGAGSIEKWQEEASKEIIRVGPFGLFERTAHKIRVQIAEQYSRMDSAYQVMTEELLESVVRIFQTILPGFLDTKGSAREKLEYLKNRMEQQEVSLQGLCDAVNILLALHIEHRTQFYPRAYSPIRNFQKYVRQQENLPKFSSSMSKEEQARVIFERLRDISTRTIIDVSDILKGETEHVKDILFVTLEHFIDVATRAAGIERQWKRMVRAFYDEIWGKKKATGEIPVSEVLSVIRIFKASYEDDFTPCPTKP